MQESYADFFKDSSGFHTLLVDLDTQKFLDVVNKKR